MTYLGNRTIELTQAEFDALPEWITHYGRTLREGQQYRSYGTGPEREPKVVEIVRQPPMFDLRESWNYAVVSGESR